VTDALRIEGLRAGYDDFDVLDGMSLRVGATERVGLFGPNGHGKTTLLNAISATLARRSGVISFFGDRIDRAKPQEIVARGLVHVAQANSLFPDMEIMETLELAAWTPRARSDRAANLDRVLALFPRLAERRRQQTKTLSGGERQMLSIGVGLMCAPRMLMLDEPTLGLSPKLKDELADAIGAITAGGTPLLLVEQDIAFVLALVDRMYLVDHGTITREIDRGGSVDHQEIMDMYFGTEAAP
jgi:branched-chain amino acid transport system ATP-binding protein